MEFHRRRRIEANIDMTPMIDTLLQLFLIFLLSASFVASSVRLDLPKAGAGDKKLTKPIMVSLDADNRLFINQEPLTVAELQIKLPTLIRLDGKRLLFSNPASEKRERMTVRLSNDDGATWTASHVLHEGPAAYSSLAALGKGRAACLYERGEQRAYEKITMATFSVRVLGAR